MDEEREMLGEKAAGGASSPPDEQRAFRPVEDVRDSVNTPLVTAMELVRSAERGEISPDQLVLSLQSWNFEPKYGTRGMADDWESRPNSFEVVEYAFLVDLIDEVAYRRISDPTGTDDSA